MLSPTKCNNDCHCNVTNIEIIYSGCWGYYLHLQEGSKIQQEYFNFHNVDKDFQKVAYLELSTSYNFTVIPLPNGPPKHLVFTSPSSCVFDLIYEITVQVGKSSMFDRCGVPGFVEKRAVAEKICKAYPSNKQKQTHAVRRELQNTNCMLEWKNL
ncbi:uncharacterized protein LOC130655434 [Hydractinia symbiolongicarpus]|uniref:uncharacterized protein LOC130655434 n=1 Tax=Hydractinia symbiolongicarpus TaxID=13093 RepID=UPI00254A7C2F|nr:uncharacterized protein LOC130655434 [Hydractinia symbiolongicarpus]